VYIAHGTYDEPATLDVQSEQAIVIDGGWSAEAALWRRDCSTTGRGQTFIRSGAPVAVDVARAPEGITFAHLTVRTKVCATGASDQIGETCIGLRVAGEPMQVVLDDVAVIAEAGGAGGPASIPSASGNSDCDGLNDCVEGDPATGSVGNDGAAAKAAGTFDAGGNYVTTMGEPGEPGGGGDNGTAGEPGQSVACASQTCVNGQDYYNSLCPWSGLTLTGNPGSCGCGGLGGGGGVAGKSGGASVALLAIGPAVTISLRGSALSSSAGGDGSSGSSGGDGGPGTAGASGSSGGYCATGCQACSPGVPSSPPCCINDQTASGGAAGGDGAPGGNGGRGGGGAGGPSHAVVLVASAVVDKDASTKLVVAGGGLGADGAADGASDATLTVASP
jgi:hypothetical protein